MQFFAKLSRFVSTRTPSQCRSHHQKIFAKFKYISKITGVFKTQIGRHDYASLLAQATQRAKGLDASFAQKPDPSPLQPSESPQHMLSNNDPLV